MNKTEFEVLTQEIRHEAQVARASDLADPTPRTLAFGYTCERQTFHIYLDVDGIHKVVYNFEGRLLAHKHESDGLLLTECVPDKRLYPETCDFDFCGLLKRRGVNLPFTNWNAEREPKAYHGKRLDELSVAQVA
ncbi:hypothetical protein WJ96_05570 [Burkholderia ubonensis]|uniref:Uncharacterized protein n=1 Tax=Burkholderia ubonensis TaxID=101571 RepID=A0AAW3MVS1_9BURK|nr:hypothetical protein [Burkholderia ubonensis]KVP75225.1 hypothetical protein WJ93_07365 [Burkholderia ubonensis]KVP96696.1 hypothetical protein WJ97_12505 [Burkholderia ubonensis]KVP98038.1 hypothetical protein WJ96_05570 [Burkholderia ubonensis]KVZ92735.1 hypothetical protein WL25_17230 [Burkholderia ubonensis]